MDASKVQLEMLTNTCVRYFEEPERRSGSRQVGRGVLGEGACNPAPDLSSGGFAPQTGGRNDVVLDLLRRPRGASASEIAGAAGWRPGRVRAFLSNPGLPLVAEEMEGGEQRYHVAALVEAPTACG
jgi:hypothetical protein